MCGRLVNLDTVARVLADYYHLKTETQLAALDEALSRVPTETVGDSHKKDHVADPGNMVWDLISRQAAIDAINRLDIPEDMCVFEILSHIELELGTLPSAQPERTCVNCGRTVNNGGWYADGRTRCPIEEHYALPKDGFCYLWEKRNVTDDDYPKRREE